MKQCIRIITISVLMISLISSSFAYYQEANSESQMTHTTLDNCEKTTTTLTFSKKNVDNCEEFEAKNYSKPESIPPSSNVVAINKPMEEDNVTHTKEVTTQELNVRFDDNWCEECSNTTQIYEMTSSKPQSITKNNSQNSVMGTIVTFVEQCFY